MKVQLIARPEFLMPEGRRPREDQMQGPDGQKLAEYAGRNCYDSMGIGRNSAEYAENILASGHGSVLEHAQYSFLIEGVSRNLMAELTRHRAGTAFSIRSTRYVDEESTPAIPHPLLEELFQNRPDLMFRFKSIDLMGRALYHEMTLVLKAQLMDKGCDSTNATKQARGAARGILVSCLGTAIVFSANVRALRHIIEQRVSEAADAEIRLLGLHLLEIMMDELPAYFSDYDMNVPLDGIGGSVYTEYGKV